MLTTLTLQNFALAAALELEIQAGFSVLTGETGAGKSLLLDALSACLGERMDSQSVRFGCDKADLTASFDLQHAPAATAWLQERELLDDASSDPQAHLRRVILSNGRSKAWINGRPASLSDLRDVGALLVQLHSQHSQQQLLHSHYARDWLDQAAHLGAQSQQVRQLYRVWQQHVQQQQAALLAQSTRLARIVALQQQLEDLEPIAPLDYAQLEQAHDRLSHFEQMMQDTAVLLEGLDGEQDPILMQINTLLRRAETQASRAPALAQVAEHLHAAHAELQEASHVLHQFVDQQEFDPVRLAELDSQLSEFHRLARKYRVLPTELGAQIHAWQAELEQLDRLADPDTLATQVAEAEQAYRMAAEQLEQQRQQAAPDLAAQLMQQVRPLALPEVQLSFEFKPFSQPQAAGLSDIQLLFSANRGMPLQALAKIASGGELSRMALVMQVMIAAQQAAPVLVFDEVDVGISGGTAEIVGRLLRKLGQHVQVLCITHQAQVAAQAHQHLLVEKQQGAQAASHIRPLSDEQRVHELARMSGGVEINASTLDHARHLRQQANSP